VLEGHAGAGHGGAELGAADLALVQPVPVPQELRQVHAADLGLRRGGDATGWSLEGKGAGVQTPQPGMPWSRRVSGEEADIRCSAYRSGHAPTTPRRPSDRYTTWLRHNTFFLRNTLSQSHTTPWWAPPLIGLAHKNLSVPIATVTVAPRGAPHLLLELHEHVGLGPAHLLPRHRLHHRHTVDLRGRLVLAQIEAVVRRVLTSTQRTSRRGRDCVSLPALELTCGR
jgi:hypothetical protein